jgi:hypothetical protein
MVRAICLFIYLQRPLKILFCAFPVAQILQDAAEVVDVCGYLRMVRAICLFIYLQRPLVVLFCSF